MKLIASMKIHWEILEKPRRLLPFCCCISQSRAALDQIRKKVLVCRLQCDVNAFALNKDKHYSSNKQIFSISHGKYNLRNLPYTVQLSVGQSDFWHTLEDSHIFSMFSEFLKFCIQNKCHFV